jgi:hypothetical protein
MSTTVSRLFRAAFLLAGISAARCSAPTAPGSVLPITRLRPEQTALVLVSGYAQPTTLVIRNSQDFATAWALLYQGVSPVPSMPTVDFSTQLVVGVAVGMRPNADTDVVITGANEANGSITFDATVTTAGASCSVLTIVTSPVDLAIVPATSTSVVADVSRKTRGC